MALNLLHNTFNKAQIVMVLDRELQQCSAHTPIVEVLTRIRCSKWMTRLWTLEEGIMAPEQGLFFLFADSGFLLDGDMENARRLVDNDDPVHRAIQRTIFMAFRRIVNFRNGSTNDRISQQHVLVPPPKFF